MRRYELHDSQWRQIEGHMPPRQPTGRPPNDFRTTFNGILWVLHSGAPQILARPSGPAAGSPGRTAGIQPQRPQRPQREDVFHRPAMSLGPESHSQAR